jgi:hypothetical protein
VKYAGPLGSLLVPVVASLKPRRCPCRKHSQPAMPTMATRAAPPTAMPARAPVPRLLDEEAIEGAIEKVGWLDPVEEL